MRDISEVFYTRDRKLAFQKVGKVYRLYDAVSGDFCWEFWSFKKMQAFINAKRKEVSDDDV